ncbi:MAG: DUF2865 domain-containing protein [Chelatococcus sp.]|uniref:DUF2865 domain-containing protein n=1 Tax=unclassified Chelatococcus TaxID=2638111 RepID=UPI001BCDF488|nr:MULTISPECIES: DUF2865 domain-containing protein [unclassified Chelatococcus]CAH1677501.1 conserved exported hypothetical protein [Hyphomicrobiales bacterium]MBS7739222.1 DUF2865 domain-containing protein [Chelatococcus sp. HY11]MBX3539345.1 DUF2865 domain-containing protein [Chelatococcus sp.]MBX3543712.1 DUF2865 domain-containing protein [Chelatococcus sp.]MCO5076245.1 DUF2865 domain-containing protein [Chelatococcus sp.]
MISRRAAYAIAATFACTLFTGNADAQEVVSPAACQRYRAELASLPRGGGQAQQYAAAAQRQRAELERTRGYYQQLGCDRGGGLFGGQRPADCSGLQARMSQMQANYDLLRSRAGGGDAQTEARRRELTAAASEACAPRTAAAPRQRGFFEMLFGGGQPEQEPSQADLDGQAPPSHGEGSGEKRLGGSRAVCVRLADGYFFPLGGPATGRSSAQELCQAQCPASPTELFFMAQGGNVAQAVSATGRPYSDLPTALQYERTLNPEISCRPYGESWAQALQPAEFMLERRKSDIIVTAEKAEELSRPKATAASQRANERQAAASAKAAAATKADDDEDAADNAAANDPSVVPTASAASSGIGPQSIAEVTTVDQDDGTLREEIGPDGQRRKVRIVAPYLVASPQNSVLINPR